MKICKIENFLSVIAAQDSLYITSVKDKRDILQRLRTSLNYKFYVFVLKYFTRVTRLRELKNPAVHFCIVCHDPPLSTINSEYIISLSRV